MLILESVPTGSKPKALIYKHPYGCLGEFNKKWQVSPHPDPHLMQQYIGPIVHSFIVWIKLLTEMYQWHTKIYRLSTA